MGRHKGSRKSRLLRIEELLYIELCKVAEKEAVNKSDIVNKALDIWLEGRRENAVCKLPF